MAQIHPILRIAFASTVLVAASLHAQQPQVAMLSDPANLTGEHIAPQSPADTLEIDHGADALQQLLLKLRSRASMMLIVAHPDDEDGGFLTYESRGQGARAGMLTLTRGEGGQNLMTADFNDALGLIRTQELLAADRYMGVDQFFGTEVDFGFSKTKEETLQKWTHDRVLYDAVRCVRLYRPLILASVFVGGVTDGHGQHQVSGEITQEVFVAAADPKVFPEMGLPPWAPLKVYARTPFFRVSAQGMYDYATGKYAPPVFHNYVTGEDIDHEPAATVTIHESTPNNVPGMGDDTYVQFARKGLAQQKSQNGGMGRGGPGGGGTVDVGYTLMASRVCKDSGCPTLAKLGWVGGDDLPRSEQSPFDGIDTSLAALADLAPDAPLTLHQSLVEALPELDHLFTTAAASLPGHLEASADPLRAALSRLDGLLAEIQSASFDPTEKFNLQHELRIKRVQLVRALTLALGITVDSVATSPKPASLTPGHAFIIRTTLNTTASMPLTLVSANLRIAGAAEDTGPAIVPAQPIATPTLLAASAPLSLTFEDRLPANTPVTRPAFSRTSLEQPFYDVADPALRDAPAAPAPLIADILLRDATGAVLEIESAVRLEQEVPGATRQIAYIVPPLSISIAPSAGIVPTGKPSFDLTTTVRPFLADAKLPVLELPPGWQAKSHADDPLPPQGAPLPESWHVTPVNAKAGEVYTVGATVTLDRHVYSESYRPVGYPGLTYTNYFKPATYKASAVDVTTAPNLRIAYLPGTGDSVPEFLPNLGVTPTLIGLKDLTPEALKPFDAVILGVRAYSAHPELPGSGSQPLIDYAKQGGVVILQYNNGRFGPDSAPYPITTALNSGDHAHDVVDESQPVQVLVPNAPLLSWPNKITAADFNNWVEERGHGFAGTWAPEFTALLETHDPEQDPQKGGLLVAPVGRGAYIYCGLALYRQLPEGVPGAYRLFANLLSYAKNPQRK
jgi:LmbE family N-acetylglucosaminyl deacetylase